MKKVYKGRNPSPSGHEDINIWSSFNAQNKKLDDALIRFQTINENIACIPSLEYIRKAINRSLKEKSDPLSLGNADKNKDDEEGAFSSSSEKHSENNSKIKFVLSELNFLRKPENFETPVPDENADDDLEAVFLGSKESDSKHPSHVPERNLSDDSSRTRVRRISTEHRDRKKSHREKKKKSKKSSTNRTYEDELEEYKRESFKSKSSRVTKRRRRYSSNSSNDSSDRKYGIRSDKYGSHRRDRRSRSRDRVSRRKFRSSSSSSHDSSDYRSRSSKRIPRRKFKGSVSRSRSRERPRSRDRSRERIISRGVESAKEKDSNSTNDKGNKESSDNENVSIIKENLSENKKTVGNAELHNESDSNNSPKAISKSLQDIISGLSVKDGSNELPPVKIKEEERSDYDYSNEEIENPCDGFFSSGTFYCKVCQKHLNGQVCYETHMKGKKHKKAEERAQLRSEASTSSSSTKLAEPLHKTEPCMKSEPPITEISTERAMCQDVVDNYHEAALPGLDYVDEIHCSDGTISYLCNLCTAPCMQQTIFTHLQGFRHYMAFLKKTDPGFYEKVAHKPKCSIIETVKNKLKAYERRFGREQMKVKIQREPDPNSCDSIPKGYNSDEEGLRINPNDYLDESGNFFCKVCNCVMNNENMLNSHLNGKRHIKNVKKTSAGIAQSMIVPTSSKKERDPSAQARLERKINTWLAEMRRDGAFENEFEGSIVGLDYIKETQNENGGEIYNCFICNFCGTIDIIEHITSMKHRTNFLETANSKEPNAIQSIKELELNEAARWGLILEQCAKIEGKKGRGKPQVYR